MYKYAEQRAMLFDEHGVPMLMDIFINAKGLVTVSGAFQADKAFKGVSGDTWTMMAALDYLVERGYLREITKPGETMGQHRVFTGGGNL